MVRQRQPRVEDAAFLSFVRRRPCCACGAPAPSQSAHIRMASEEHGKRSTGLGERPDDKWATPLCSECHLTGPQAQHRGSERAFWSRVGVDPFAVARRLYALYESKAAPRAASTGLPRKPSRANRTTPNGGTLRKRELINRPKRKWPSRPMQSRKFGRKP
jgi:hypothetical protein